jgi:hypothetical protein
VNAKATKLLSNSLTMMTITTRFDETTAAKTDVPGMKNTFPYYPRRHCLTKCNCYVITLIVPWIYKLILLLLSNTTGSTEFDSEALLL